MKSSVNLESISNWHNKLKHSLIARYRLYVQRYIAYARLRGFKSFNDLPYHWRGFIQCWTEPGFHKFWQIWNPGIAYFVYRLYIKLGGHKNWILATLLSFEINGLIHSLIFYLISGQWSFVIPILFLLFGLLTILSKILQSFLRQDKWPWLINTLINAGLVVYTFDISFKVNQILFVYFKINP